MERRGGGGGLDVTACALFVYLIWAFQTLCRPRHLARYLLRMRFAEVCKRVWKAQISVYPPHPTSNEQRFLCWYAPRVPNTESLAQMMWLSFDTAALQLCEQELVLTAFLQTEG